MKARQRLFSYLLAAVLAMSAAPGIHARESAPSNGTQAGVRFYPAGEGTEQNPWQIAIPGHLVWINAVPARTQGYFLLVNDISAPTNIMIGSGSPAFPFSGSFDGGGNTITVNINLPGQDNLGLFRRIGKQGRVRNLTVAGRVTGQNYVGALAGASSGHLSNIQADADVSGYLDVGGLVGRNDFGGEVIHSHASGAVNGVRNVGGLAGVNDGTVRGSYASGDVRGSLGTGGLVGSNNASVVSSYATGNVSGEENVGGLLGKNYGSAAKSSTAMPPEM